MPLYNNRANIYTHQLVGLRAQNLPFPHSKGLNFPTLSVIINIRALYPGLLSQIYISLSRFSPLHLVNENDSYYKRQWKSNEKQQACGYRKSYKTSGVKGRYVAITHHFGSKTPSFCSSSPWNYHHNLAFSCSRTRHCTVIFDCFSE
ncbi:hypothetical protein VTO42DRAFT_6807 [Malbranchea cinnamomea]